MTDYDLSHYLEEEARVDRKAMRLPDELQFVNDDGVPLDDIEVITLTWEQKVGLARVMLRQKQSLETVILRALNKAVKNEHY